MNRAFQRMKQTLVAVGARIPKKRLIQTEMVVSYMRLGAWMREHGFEFRQRFPKRTQCFDLVAETIGDRPALLTEFGVHKGYSLRYWSKILRHPRTELHGFDSFEGLPETFSDNQGLDRARFDVGGALPVFDDARVHLHKGWFSNTLPEFTVPAHDQLVLCLDADLYSSTVTVLRHLDRWIVPGTFIYFDEFAYIHHEPLAFHEYIADTGKRFEGFCADWTLNRCIFRAI